MWQTLHYFIHNYNKWAINYVVYIMKNFYKLTLTIEWYLQDV